MTVIPIKENVGGGVAVVDAGEGRWKVVSVLLFLLAVVLWVVGHGHGHVRGHVDNQQPLRLSARGLLRFPRKCHVDLYWERHREEYMKSDVESGQGKDSMQYHFFKTIWSTAQRPMLFVDIGANRGDVTAMVLGFDSDTHVHAYDVRSSFVEKLKVRFRTKANVHVHHKAIADRPSLGLVDIKGLEESAGDVSNTFFTKKAPMLTRARGYGTVLVRVPATTLDELYYKRGRTVIDVLKINTDGFDARVLHGAYRLLHDKRISVLFWENNAMQKKVGDSLFATVKYLNRLGYRSFLFGRKNNIALDGLCETSLLFNSTDTVNVVTLLQ